MSIISRYQVLLLMPAFTMLPSLGLPRELKVAELKTISTLITQAHTNDESVRSITKSSSASNMNTPQDFDRYIVRLFEQGNKNLEIIQIAATALEKTPLPRYLLFEALGYSENNEYDKMISTLNEFQRKPSSANVLFQSLSQSDKEGWGLGLCQAAIRALKKNDPAAALALTSSASIFIPSDIRVWIVLADSSRRLGLTERSLGYLSKAKAINPKNPGIWSLQGYITLDLKNFKEAVLLFQKSLAIDPSNYNAWMGLGISAMRDENYTLSLIASQSAEALMKGDSAAITNEGLALFELGKPREAMRKWQEVLTGQPDFTESAIAYTVASASFSGQTLDSDMLALQATLKSTPELRNLNYLDSLNWGPKLRLAASHLFEKAK